MGALFSSFPNSGDKSPTTNYKLQTKFFMGALFSSFPNSGDKSPTTNYLTFLGSTAINHPPRFL
ncbi:MAG: hypothetical protein DRR08_31610 [Candidatus Parabeggiatoa sp. nov. 2]|nr:MAG: hypothetical protein DRR08_31610 [Gammaproteobacteria bacterium]